MRQVLPPHWCTDQLPEPSVKPLLTLGAFRPDASTRKEAKVGCCGIFLHLPFLDLRFLPSTYSYP